MSTRARTKVNGYLTDLINALSVHNTLDIKEEKQPRRTLLTSPLDNKVSLHNLSRQSRGHATH